jgi:hypothetical protein
MTESPETWKITVEDRTKHNATFMQLGPLNGQHLTGDQAKSFFIKSNLPVSVLGVIWNLADINKDGRLDRREFSIACFLIKKCLTSPQGAAVLPAELPSALQVDPMPTAAGANIPPPLVNNVVPPQQPLFQATFPSAPMMSPPPAVTSSTAIPSLIPTSSSFSNPVVTPAGAVFTPLATLNTSA